MERMVDSPPNISHWCVSVRGSRAAYRDVVTRDADRQRDVRCRDRDYDREQHQPGGVRARPPTTGL
jgi:hypothetical protein